MVCIKIILVCYRRQNDTSSVEMAPLCLYQRFIDGTKMTLTDTDLT